MEYKELFKQIYRLIRQPRNEWQTIVEHEKDSTKVINNFVIPMTGICALCAFLGQLFQGAGFEKALIAVIISLGKNFGGVYFTFFILQETAKFFGTKRNKTAHLQLVGYSFVAIFTIDIIYKLIPEFFFLPILQLYILYIIWEASEIVVKIEDKKRVMYVFFTSITMLALSSAIGTILSKTIKASSEIIAA